MSPNVVRRTAVGFQGGQVLSLRLTDEALTSFRDALKQGTGGWLEVEASDGAVLVDARQVVYLRVESDEQRIGFGRIIGNGRENPERALLGDARAEAPG